MATYERLPRGRPKQPDEFISFFDRLYHEAYRRGPMVIAVVAILALVGVGIVFWREYHLHKSDRLATSLYQASKQGAPAEEKILREIKNSHFYMPLGIWASLELANQPDEKKDCEKVLKDLSSYVGHGDNKMLRSLVYLKVGYCLQEKKDWSRAQGVYQEAMSDSKNLFKDWAALSLAQVYQASGNNEEAKKLLQEIVESEKPYTPAVKEQARVKLNLLS